MKQTSARLFRYALATFVLVVASTTLQAQNPYTSEEGGFRVAFPSGFPDPNVDSKDVETKIGTIQMKTFLTEQPNAACMVAYSDYPAESFEGASTQALLDSARNGALSNVGGKLIKQRNITINGYPGRSIYFRGKSGSSTVFGRFDYYLVQPRLYQVGYMTLRQKDIDAKKVKAYFSSFGLLDISTGGASPR